MTEQLASAPNLTDTWLAIAALVTFLLAYAFVLTEEVTEMRKSKPVVLASGVIWVLVALSWQQHHLEGVEDLLRHNLDELAGLFLFLLAAMTFVNTLQERRVFEALRSWLVSRGYSLRTMYWITGSLAFVLSPVLDNLTTALVMGAVVLAIARDQRDFVVPTLISIVVAANAGGAFSPFGDVTTLMVWQAGTVSFLAFFKLLLPSLVNWLVPAIILSIAIPAGFPIRSDKRETLKPYAVSVIGLFAGHRRRHCRFTPGHPPAAVSMNDDRPWSPENSRLLHSPRKNWKVSPIVRSCSTCRRT